MSKKIKKISAAFCAFAVTVSCFSSMSAAAVSEISYGEEPAALELFDAGNVAITAAAFPDAQFRKYVSENFDKDGSGTLSQQEISNVDRISVLGSSSSTVRIKSLKGVEYFTNLKYLNCYNNQLTSLDVSKNTALKSLDCSSNMLTSLNVNYNSQLERLTCDNNELTSLNITNNPALISLYCYSNYLTQLNTSKNTQLKTLSCGRNSISSLNLNNNRLLESLSIDSNPITAINVSSNTSLKTLEANSCYLTSLDVTNNTALKTLYCSRNMLTSLDVRYNTALKYLSCSSNCLKSLNVSKNTALEDLSCGYNQLTSLDVSKNTTLKTLSCSDNRLASLDVSKNTALTSLSDSGNRYYIGDSPVSYSLSKLPAGFDSAKASDWKGATYNKTTNSLTNFTSNNVTYTYNCGNGFSKTHTLTTKAFLPIPGKPLINVVSGVNCAKVSWAPVNNASRYTVCYYTGSESSKTVKTADTSVLINGLTGGEKYTFYVTAYYNDSSIPSTSSMNVYARIKTASAPAKPVFTVTPGVNRVVLRWNAVSGAKCYRVYYRVSGTSKWSYRNTTVTAMNLTGLTGGKKYDLLVRAYNGSAWSSFTSSDIKKATPTAASAKPVISSVTAGVNSAVLRWNAVSGAQSYRVYYRVSGTSKWSYKNTTKNAMNLTGLTGGKTYEFVVRAYNGSTWTAFSSADIVKAAIKR